MTDIQPEKATMNRKTSPLQRLRDGTLREKREHPGVPPRNPDPHPRAPNSASVPPARLSAVRAAALHLR